MRHRLNILFRVFTSRIRSEGGFGGPVYSFGFASCFAQKHQRHPVSLGRWDLTLGRCQAEAAAAGHLDAGATGAVALSEAPWEQSLGASDQSTGGGEHGSRDREQCAASIHKPAA